jgi:hypothetical protein
MWLKTAHKILISSGIVLGLLLVLYASFRYMKDGDSSFIATGVLGAVFSVLLAFYLRWFLSKAKQSPS